MEEAKHRLQQTPNAAQARAMGPSSFRLLIIFYP